MSSSSSSSASPRFVTFVAQHDDAKDEFGQPSCITMQLFMPDHPLLDVAKGYISFGGADRADEGIWSPYAKFEMEPAGRAGMVHLKSSYNGKYLRKGLEGPNNFNIHAVADEPEEDISKWSCTMFRISDNGLQIQYNRRMWTLQAEIQGGLFWLRLDDGKPKPNDIKIYTKFDMVDLDMLPTFPTDVCFKADNEYLKVVQTLGVRPTIRAVFTGNDRREQEALFRVVPTRLRSVVLVPVAYPDTYLAREGDGDGGYIASRHSFDWRNAPLVPVTLDFDGPTAIAFRSATHPNRHLTVRRENDNAFAVSNREIGITAQAEFVIEDTVRGRQISNVKFLYDDMKTSNVTPVTVLTKNVVNLSTVSTQEAHLAFKYSEYHSKHLETTHSWKVGVSAGYSSKVSVAVPVIKFVQAEVTYSVGVEAGYQEEHTVGETKAMESEMLTSLTVQVPPRTQSFVHMTVSRAKIQLPFTYTQREVLYDGSAVANKKVDGFYEGEATHVDYQVEESSM